MGRSRLFRLITAACIGISVVVYGQLLSASGSKPVTIKIATTPTPSERLTHDETRPGYLVEMFNRVEKLANVKFEYVFADWDQVLRLVRTGRVEAGFNSSFKLERTAYGAYPMVDGNPDPSRANIKYAYSLFTHRNSDIRWDGETVAGLMGTVGVEKGASIISKLEALNIPYREIKTYESMMSLLAGGRIKAIAAIDDHLEAAARNSGHRFGDIKRLEPNLQTRIGYLMFSKRFCDRAAEVCEAVWDAIRDVRNSDEYTAVRAKYGN